MSAAIRRDRRGTRGGRVRTDISEGKKEVDDWTHVRLTAVWSTGKRLSSEERIKNVLTEGSAETVCNLQVENVMSDLKRTVKESCQSEPQRR